MTDNISMLRVGTILQSKYRIEEYLASGGFGNTYVATHLGLDKRVAIKEFFMKGVNHRENDTITVSVSNPINKGIFEEQRRKFKKEAQRLTNLDNIHIVKVFDLFEDNNTVYYVMDFIDGESLSAKMKRIGLPYSESKVMSILDQMLDALDAIHAKSIWHMDIKPGNILMDNSGRCTLIDFGSSKHNDQSDGSTTSTALSYTPGYAPPEQINGSKDRWSARTDYYALGATLYNLLTGNRPPLSDDILNEDDNVFNYPSNISEEIKLLIKALMNPAIAARPKSSDEIRSFLKPSIVEVVQDDIHEIPDTTDILDTPPTVTNEETNINNAKQDEENVTTSATTVIVDEVVNDKVPSNSEYETQYHSDDVDNKQKSAKSYKFLYFFLSTIIFILIGALIFFITKDDFSSDSLTTRKEKVISKPSKSHNTSKKEQTSQKTNQETTQPDANRQGLTYQQIDSLADITANESNKIDVSAKNKANINTVPTAKAETERKVAQARAEAAARAKAQAEAERKAAQARAQADAYNKAQVEAERKAAAKERANAAAKAKAEAKAEAERKAAQAKKDAAARALAESERKAAEARAKAEAERKKKEAAAKAAAFEFDED